MIGIDVVVVVVMKGGLRGGKICVPPAALHLNTALPASR